VLVLLALGTPPDADGFLGQQKKGQDSSVLAP
jgi:hypothetical protein